MNHLDNMKGNQQYATYSSDDEDDGNTNKRKAMELSRALAVLGIKPSTFHSLHTNQKTEQIKELLETSLKKRMDDLKAGRTGPGANPNNLGFPSDDEKPKTPRKSPNRNAGRTPARTTKKKMTYEPHVDHDADLPTMHEAYQFLTKNYVDDISAKKITKVKMGTSAIKAMGGTRRK